ncbi:putative nuclease HARBI1 [Gymnodraco acuticeps]|uniref:Nuclease HARBI1 n=1 Tax=Gymnodraco acuticeps TaxID=8218 RepID=A0A6P8UF96_GYMAC|nr:putative nuclease HARBI1 [Gymnodraco acuticeps]
MVSNSHLHLSAALTCVAIRRLLAGAMARSNRRRRRLRRILAMWQGGKGLYMQLNATAPILAVYANPEACLKKDFRVKRSSVVYLVQMLSSPKDHGWGQDIEVLVLLYSLAHGLSLSVVGSAFRIPKSTVHRIIKHVTGKIKANLKTLISLPTPDELPEIADGFCQLAKSPAFHRAAGAIDGCHIRIKPPGNEYHKEYINYKLFPSIQMQAICDSTGRFLDVFIGYPGSVHDARVLRNSPIFCQALFPPAGWFLLGDGGYPCLEKPVGLLTPYKVPRGQVQARFNRHHARARSVVERAFGRMKARWRATLFKALEVSPSFAPDIIACCAFLHNLCIDMNDVLEDAEAFPPEDGDQSPPPAAAFGQESPGQHLRNRIAAQLSVPVQMAPHLREHDYI